MKRNLLMLGVHASNKGGMWTVAQNYMASPALNAEYDIRYLAMTRAGGRLAVLLYTFFSFVRLFFLLVFTRVDLVYIHMASRGSFFRKAWALRLAKWFKKPVLIHLHGAMFEVFYDALTENKKSYVRHIFTTADRVVCLGENWAAYLKKICGEGVRTEVLHNAVPVQTQNPYDPAATEAIFLGYVGPRKGAFDLLKALEGLGPQLPKGVVFALYGNGELVEAAELVAQYGLEGLVELRGWISADDRPAALARAMVNLLPSYHEGLPMSVLETMAAGIPNISTRIAAIPEVIEDGENGILITPGDIPALRAAILRLCCDADLRREMGGRAHQTILERFSMENHVRRLKEILAGVPGSA